MQVLIAILNNPTDREIARHQHWYRIPIEAVAKLKQRHGWPPEWLAFYQTKVFGDEAYTITDYAQVIHTSEVYRWQLFPDVLRDGKSENRYCKLELGPLQRLPQPIRSDRLRRVSFIPTTLEKLHTARDIRDLW